MNETYSMYYVMDLPIELWYIILDTLGEYAELRAHTNLCKALGIDPNIGSKYRVKALIESRLKWCNENKISYSDETTHKKLVEFWKKTVIDDGLEGKYLKTHLDKHTRMYRTVFTWDTLYNKEKFILHKNPANRYFGDCIIIQIRNKIYIDNRIIDEVYDGSFKPDEESIEKWKTNFEGIIETYIVKRMKVVAMQFLKN